ncbi:MAG: type II secretion system F family protein [Candidatus Binatus sp.]|uniref:type II secretion system F family protein n=1 Tax=Candidatus Binatus sp. TaxID=2811406 RepID=UPI0027268F36|nr:type II secretion system F family protein [Candidatus Binatus sp.]MDO8431821.1 type II secretion system F family protein [Candidatus Binatus sp.]
MSPMMVGVAVFFLAGAAAIALYIAFAPNTRAMDETFADLAVKMRVSLGALEGGEVTDDNLLRMMFRWAAKRVPPPDVDSPNGEKLQQTLAQAGFLKSSAPQTYQVIRVMLAAGCAFIGLIVGLILHSSASQPIVFAAGGAVVGIFVPSYILGRRARLRQAAISRQLSDVLDLLVVCVEAGLGLYEAIQIVGAESERHGQEIGTELNLVSAEISAGASLGQALRSLADRTAVEDIKPLAATLIQSEQLGAQISPALHASSDALRMRRRLRAEEMAQKATIKILFPLVLFVLPSMIAVIVGPAMIQVIRTLSGVG